MKKTIILIAVGLFCCTSLPAQSIRLFKGSLPKFETGDLSRFGIDMVDATWEEDEMVKHHFDDYDDLIDEMTDIFRITFNKNSSNLKIKDDTNAKYSLILRPLNFECKVGAAWKKKVRLWGDLFIVNRASNTVLCVLRLTEFKADESDYVEADAVVKCMSTLAETLTHDIFK